MLINIQLPMCLLFKKILTNDAMKPSRLKYHLTGFVLIKQTSLFPNLFQALKERQNQSSISKVFTKTTCQNVKELIASCKIAFFVAKRVLPLNVGESLVVTAMKEIISTVMESDPAHVLQTVPLSDTTLKQRIDEMGTNIEDQLCGILRNTSFSLQLDKTTTSDNNT